MITDRVAVPEPNTATMSETLLIDLHVKYIQNLGKVRNSYGKPQSTTTTDRVGRRTRMI